MDIPQQQAIKALRSISRNEEIKAYLLQNPPLYKTVLRAAMRFIGGETFDECLLTAKGIMAKGHAFTVDFMGESTRDEQMANEVAEEFLQVIEEIKRTKSNASVSLDLSHIGMSISKELAYENALLIAKKAKEEHLEVMISMEGIDRVDHILELHKRLCDAVDNVGITHQAYLHRTAQDLQEALKRPGKIRLVKGAYEVSQEFSLPLGEETNEAYKKYLEQILTTDHKLSIASHDEDILAFADDFINKHKVSKDNIEFEMLHGVKPELLSKMHDKGYKTKEYLPYGKEWYLYLCHRLAENPENIYQAFADAVAL